MYSHCICRLYDFSSRPRWHGMSNNTHIDTDTTFIGSFLPVYIRWPSTQVHKPFGYVIILYVVYTSEHAWTGNSFSVAVCNLVTYCNRRPWINLLTLVLLCYCVFSTVHCIIQHVGYNISLYHWRFLICVGYKWHCCRWISIFVFFKTLLLLIGSVVSNCLLLVVY